MNINSNNQHNEDYYWMLLASTDGVGCATALKLIEAFGSAKLVFAQSIATLSTVVNKKIASLIYNKSGEKKLEESLNWLRESDNHHIITLHSKEYPVELANIHHMPILLFLKGRIELLKNKKIAVVGTRHPTHLGIDNAKRFAKELSNYGLTIVSGMAAGIDRYAHLGGLDGLSSSIGVIGSGISITYPKVNIDIYHKMYESGLIISEYPIKMQPIPANFPRRNRIISGLSLACLVVESTINGGGMISANQAIEMGREVMAIPGSTHNPVGRGCNHLIKSGAKLVENVSDIIDEINYLLKSSSKENTEKTAEQIGSTKHNQLVKKNQSSQLSCLSENCSQTLPQQQLELSAMANKILSALSVDAITIDKISEKTQIEFDALCNELLFLELNGIIINCGNGRYQQSIISKQY